RDGASARASQRDASLIPRIVRSESEWRNLSLNMPMLPSTNVLDELSRFSPPGARYFSHLPLRNPAMLCTLGEGNTPLVRSERLGPELGIPELYFKLESTNPSGSYKDRLM